MFNEKYIIQISAINILKEKCSKVDLMQKFK